MAGDAPADETTAAPTPPARGGRLAAAFGGSLAALVRPGRILVLRLPNLEPFAELGIEGDPETTDIAFLEGGGRLAVLSRAAGGSGSTLYVIDPDGPAKVGELALAGQDRLVAVAGSALLIAGPPAALVDGAQAELRADPLPLRSPLAAGGRLGPGRFLIASGGAIEEWDAATRAPVRRLRVDRPLPEHLGGNAQRIWMVLRADPICVETISLASRASRRIELPEPIGRVVPHPGGDALVIIGAASRTAYLIDLVRERSLVSLEGGPTSDAAWLDPRTLLLGPIDGSLAIATIPEPGRATAPMPAIAPAPEAPAIEHAPALAPPAAEHPGIVDWRGDLIAWARGARRSLPGRMPIDDVIARLELGDARGAVALLYAARLLGTGGASAADLASVSGWDWTLALGGGRLAASGLARRRRDRWHLIEEVAAFLDERAPLRGELVDGPGAPPASVAVVAPVAMALSEVARRTATYIGPLLVPNERGERDPRRFLLEARVRGLLPLVPLDRFRAWIAHPARAALVVSDEDRARALDLPVISVA